MSKKFKCPTCKGKGSIDTPYAQYRDMHKKQKQAQKLRETGLTLEEIARVMGYTNASGARKLLNRREQ